MAITIYHVIITIVHNYQLRSWACIISSFVFYFLIQSNNNSLLRLLVHELTLTTFLKQHSKINHDILSPQTCICLFLFLQLVGKKDWVNLKTLLKRFHCCGLLNISFNDFLVLINVFVVCEILHKCKIPWRIVKSRKGILFLKIAKNEQFFIMGTWVSQWVVQINCHLNQ